FAGLIGALAIYFTHGYSWLALLIFLLAPDLSAVSYLLNPQIGAAAYNTVHNYALPLALGGLSLFFGWNLGIQIALIWLAHIGMDRMFGFGLKYATGFKDTHLGKL